MTSHLEMGLTTASPVNMLSLPQREQLQLAMNRPSYFSLRLVNVLLISIAALVTAGIPVTDSTLTDINGELCVVDAACL